jgi:GH35 family endo-1,4-beta-xylanase
LGTVTPENCLKPNPVQVTEGRYDFTLADAFVCNDYNNELPGKREKQMRLLRSLRERQVPVHAVGLQGHYELDRIPFQDIEGMLRAVRELGLKVVVSEVDLDVVQRPGGSAGLRSSAPVPFPGRAWTSIGSPCSFDRAVTTRLAHAKGRM